VSFLNPVFLFGLLAASIPIVIHLFTRRRPKDVPFPSLEFLSEVNQSEIRRLRIKQWLLLLLRTLAVAAIAFAMARPALRGTIGPRGTAATTVVVLVDRSGSMGAAAPASLGGGTLEAEARRVVESVLATLGVQDECLLIPYANVPQPVTPAPSSDMGRLRAATHALEPLAATTDHRRALELASSAFSRSHALNRELFWISDFQASGSGEPGSTNFAAAPGDWNQIRTYLVPITPRSRSNIGLTEAALTPADGSIALSVAGRAFAATAGDLAVEAQDAANNETIGRGFLDMPQQGDASALLPLSRVPDQGGVAMIPDDVLPVDNRRYFASGRAGTLRILMLEVGAPSPLRLALEAGSPASGLSVETLNGGDVSEHLTQTDALVINDLERLGSAETQDVLDFYRAGGGLFLVLGDHADTGFWNSFLHDLSAGDLGGMDQAPAGGAWRLSSVTPGHPVLSGFPARPGEPLSSARFQTIRSFHPGGTARVIIEFDRAHPALVELPHGYVWCSSLDPSASDFPVSGAFLPLFHQITRVLARGTAAGSLTPGEVYTAPASTGAWRIEDREGHEVASELKTEHGATRLVSAPLEQPGLYRVLLGGSLRTTFAVNVDPAESDLAEIPERALVSAFPAGRVQIMRPGADLARRVREARYGRELWSWFVILALLLLVTEMIVGRAGMTARAPVPQPAMRS
jgi:hypothetical protein